MQNFTLIAPNTLQVTHQNQDLQEKEFRFLNKNINSKLNFDSCNYFIEKHIGGYSNILNAISKKEKVYFMLPAIFNKDNVLQFVQDFLIACFYTRLTYIVFDRSRCIQSMFIADKEKIDLCDEIEMMFKRSDLPVVYVEDSNENNEHHFEYYNSMSLSYKLINVNKKVVDLKELNSVVNKVHKIMSLKEELFLSKQQITYKNKTANSINKDEFKYTYTLN